MTTAKELFLRPSPDATKATTAQWWAMVCHDPRFAEVMTIARADMMENRPTQAQMEGAEIVLSTLKTLCDADDTGMEMPSPGLHHSFNVPKTDQEKA